MKKTSRICRSLVSLMLAAVIVFEVGAYAGLGAYSATMSELQDQRNQLQEQLKNINDSINKIENAEKQLQEKINTLNARTSIVRSQIDLCKQAISITEANLVEKQKELDQKKLDIEKTYELFKQRLRAMYMSNDTTLLSVFMQSNSLSDFFIKSEALKRVSKHDTDIVNRLTEEQQQIETAKAEVEKELKSLNDQKAELDNSYSSLASLIREANSALDEQSALMAAKQADYDKARAEFKAVEDEIARQASESDGSFVGGEFRWPVPGYSYLSTYFGWTTDPWSGASGYYHYGIDIAGWNIYGKSVIASNSGRVIKEEYTTSGYGIYVILDHGGGITTVYAHLSSISVKKGSYVYQGDKIGEVGSSGNSTGPHLHFSVYVNGYAKDPLNYVSYGW